jgi:hypothetical protein
MLTATRLKVTTALNAGELLGIPAPEGTPRVSLRIELPNRTVTANIATKSLHKAQTAVRGLGADNVVVAVARLPRGRRCDR